MTSCGFVLLLIFDCFPSFQHLSLAMYQTFEASCLLIEVTRPSSQLAIKHAL